MKKITFINSDPFFDKNYMFMHEKPDHMLFPLFALKQELKKRNIEVHTSDLLPKKDADYIVYNEAPKKNLFKKRLTPSEDEKKKSFLMLLECPIIRPDNFNEHYHSYFKKVFTWDDGLVLKNNKKYVKLNFTQSFKKSTKNIARDRFCVCVSGNKKVKHTNELYSKRLEIIKWFEINDLSNFDLYGRGWGHMKFNSNTILRPFNRIFTYLPEYKFRSSWRGPTENKLELLQRYKFNICIENAKNYHGYITEKIFDSFRAGCIPIYSGPPNIHDYIPSNCFINLDKFSDFEDCYKYMKTIDDKEFERYSDSINDFLNSTDAKRFEYNYFIETFIKTLNL